MANFNINIKVKERASRSSGNGEASLTDLRSERIDRKDRVRERSPDRNSQSREKHEANEKTESRKKELRIADDHLNQGKQSKPSEKDFREEKDGEKPLGSNKNNEDTNENINEDNEDNEDNLVEETEDVASLMGFESFGSTKGKHVKGARGGGTKIEKETEYRRYMNREKGSNRPLSPTR
ncbi:Piso0_000485 [Millerozyma farinosa CBS 7064]|uniref:Piso0_000485 protein n=1 Tax=Pichia sorbitophila (strain ATCC MYA-4447 / BCRC 22081 / CBS 7064 / NBRC 10061 / NRRL Y-12695) TaxID=559304 RepID=G8YVK0_PICSO|nr:Piso0_000485 [Millerozyma farinosa CBS 7064]CCE73444.1 Piso0_000485 [Millerozyma farinosa CBS 7064]